MHMFGEFASFLLLLLDERPNDSDVSIQNRAELLAADHLDQSLFIGLWHLSRLL